VSREIEHVKGRCGGRAVVAGTRMTVWGLSRLTPKEALTLYPHLTEEQIFAAHAYAAAHPEEIAKDIREQGSCPDCGAEGVGPTPCGGIKPELNLYLVTNSGWSQSFDLVEAESEEAAIRLAHPRGTGLYTPTVERIQLTGATGILWSYEHEPDSPS